MPLFMDNNTKSKNSSEKIKNKKIKSNIIYAFEAGKRLHKKAAAIITSLSLVAGTGTVLALKAMAKERTAVYIDGSRVCYLSDESEYESAMQRLYEFINSSEDADYEFDHELKTETVQVCNSVADSSECYDILYSKLMDDYQSAYMIYSDGMAVGACLSYDEAESVIGRLKDEVRRRISEWDDNVTGAELINEFEIKEESCSKKSIYSPDELYQSFISEFLEKYGGYLPDGANEAVTLPAIAEGASPVMLKSDISDPEEEAVSPLVNTVQYADVCSDGDEDPTCKISFRLEMTVKETRSVTLAPMIEYEESYDYYEGETVLKTEGRNGQADITYNVTYVNGVETSSEEISRDVKSEAVNTVYSVGTRKLTDPTGTLIWPLNGDFYLSSDYGVNRGAYLDGRSYHTGIDLPCAKGTPVYAADGGEVVFAGRSGSYGYIVKIRHNDGMETWYAHLSKMNVLAGELVYKGQQIGEVGNTGRAYGYHLHFEVRIDENAKNPLEYLPDDPELVVKYF